MDAQEKLEQELERLMDGSSLLRIIEALATVCRNKAEHLRTNWQDEIAAKSYEKDAAKLDSLSTKINN